MYNPIQLLQLLRRPILEPHQLGLQLKTHRGNLKFYGVEDETPAGYCGIEWECKWSPGTSQARAIYAALKTEFQRNATLARVATLDQHSYDISATLKEAVRTLVFSGRSKLYSGEPHFDGGGIECTFAPISHAGIKAASSEFERIFELGDAFGLTPLHGGDGIHLNMDLSLYGRTKDEQIETCARILRFAFVNYDYIVAQSLRTNISQMRADIPSLLGDMFRTTSQEDFNTLFMDQKELFLNALRGDSSLKAFNIGIRTDRRPVLEIRWFGSTIKIEDLLAVVDFGFAQAEFFKSNDTTSLEQFANYAKSNVTMYEHLYAHMQANPYSAVLMNLAYSTPQLQFA